MMLWLLAIDTTVVFVLFKTRDTVVMSVMSTSILREHGFALCVSRLLSGQERMERGSVVNLSRVWLLIGFTSPFGVNRITYWSQLVASLPHKCQLPYPPLDNIRVMMIIWRLRGNIIRAPCWVVWHNVHSQQHTHVSSSYRSSRLGLSHWDLYTMHRGVCLEVYYCYMVEWSWWDTSLIWKTN